MDFALIGHQESWRAATDVLAALRGPGRASLPEEDVREIFAWIPPRPICHVEVTSATGAKARGIYIESFIPPDRLNEKFAHENLKQVQAAAVCAINAGAKIVSLGGFSSILIEGNFDLLPKTSHTIFTTGNTLTVALIVGGIKEFAQCKAGSSADQRYSLLARREMWGPDARAALLPLSSG
jgi:fatty aldehyde-generating acyl-ACP reductase